MVDVIEKIVRFITKKKKTILEKDLVETRDKFREVIYNNGSLLDLEINEKLVSLQGKIEYLIEKDYHEEILRSLNGILIELIDKSIENNKIADGQAKKLKETLVQYEKFIDDLIVKLQEKENLQRNIEAESNNKSMEKFGDIVESIREDINKDKGVF